MMATTDVTILGAGPYGLSIAAHLEARGVDHRIVGGAMESWRVNMPKGMLLKSAGCSSNLSDPGRTFTLRRYCEDGGLEYDDFDIPVALETFCSYGMAFQRRFVPHLQDDKVAAIRQAPRGFDIQLKSGESFSTNKVVFAVGLDHFRHLPEPLARLPKTLVSHSADHQDLRRFARQDVVVLGSGASAIDTAVLLHEANANVQHVVRADAVHFGFPWNRSPDPFRRRIGRPVSKIGPGWKSFFLAGFPWAYHFLPDNVRIHTARTHLGPEGGWFMKDRARSVPVLLGCRVRDVAVSGGRVRLRLVRADGSERQVSADHVIAATGYRPDVRRLSFLSSELAGRLRLESDYPLLSPHFESSVRGLYFVGPIAAATFGPVMRFAAGADFTARRLSRRLARCMESVSTRIAVPRESRPMAVDR